MRLLVVEDEKYLNKTLTERLTKAGYSVDSTTEITVADNGVGISEKHIDKIWGRFYRVDDVRNDEFGSSGLGLSMVKSIIELHGGSVGVSSTPGEGTIFRITLNRD